MIIVKHFGKIDRGTVHNHRLYGRCSRCVFIGGERMYDVYGPFRELMLMSGTLSTNIGYKVATAAAQTDATLYMVGTRMFASVNDIKKVCESYIDSCSDLDRNGIILRPFWSDLLTREAKPEHAVIGQHSLPVDSFHGYSVSLASGLKSFEIVRLCQALSAADKPAGIKSFSNVGIFGESPALREAQATDINQHSSGEQKPCEGATVAEPSKGDKPRIRVRVNKQDTEIVKKYSTESATIPARVDNSSIISLLSFLASGKKIKVNLEIGLE